MTVKLSNPKDSLGIRKAPMSTVSATVLLEVGLAMLEGAAKYGKFNYRAVGVRSSVYYDATMRHLMSWYEGEDVDPDSGMSHITKAIASLVVLRDAMIQGMVDDDRPPRSKLDMAAYNTHAGEILDRHADKRPAHYTQLGCEVDPWDEALREIGIDPNKPFTFEDQGMEQPDHDKPRPGWTVTQSAGDYSEYDDWMCELMSFDVAINTAVELRVSFNTTTHTAYAHILRATDNGVDEGGRNVEIPLSWEAARTIVFEPLP